MTDISASDQFVGGLKNVARRLRHLRYSMRAAAMLARFEGKMTVSSDLVHGFNSRCRDLWVADRAKSVLPASRVLDVGAGTAPYRSLFNHCKYETHDFAQYNGYMGSEGQYSALDYVSDITSIPVPDSSFDIILCTEVLEHVPRPIEALKELVRITKPGGRLFLTAPLGSGLHQEPYHFYGGYTDHWYRMFLTEFNCEIISIEPNHGFFAHLAQECARFSWTFEQHKHEHGRHERELRWLMGEVLPRYFYELDEKIPIREFTVGFFVEAERKP
jgi:ubiquinone/menaquinone biosynthesis C-methylase UbiE